MQNVLTGFLLRWFTELGGIFALIAGAYFAAPSSEKAAIEAIFTGSGGDLPINAIVGLALYGWGRWMAYRATVAPQVVTTGGQKLTPKSGSAVEQQIDAVAVGVKPQSLKPTLWEQLTQSFRR